MIPLRAVLLDFGGVLYRMPDPQRLMRFLRLMGVRDPGALRMMNLSPRESPFVSDLMTGKTNEQQVWDELARSWGMRPGLVRFLRKHGLSSRNLNRDLLVYFNNLRPRYTTAVLTNAGTDFRNTFAAAYQLHRFTDHLIVSAEEGLAKPDEAIYLLAARRLGMPPQAILFVDDVLENVEGARQAGMQAFLFTNPQDTIQKIDAFLQTGDAASG